MIPSDFNLDGKIGLIVGNARGWLQPLAGSLSEAGARVIAVDRESSLTTQIENINQKPDQGPVRTLSMDFTDPRNITETVNLIVAEHGQIDILINNLDYQFAVPAAEMTIDEWSKVINVNLTSVFHWTQSAGKHMVARQQGSIINISSVLAERGLPHCTAYCAACGGVSQFSKALALEWAPYNVRVNTLGVGWTSSSGEVDKSQERLARYSSIGRFCRPEDVAAMLVYLASSASSYVTGQTYFVSGGVMAHG